MEFAPAAMRCWAVLSADIIIKALLLVLAALIAAATPARAAEPNPLEFRAEGSFPVKYVETQSDTFHRNRISGEPFFALVATAHLMPDLNVSMFANGGHDPLTGFRDNDNTFMSFGANAVKRWGAFSVGASMEHTQFYQGAFGPPTNDANDANLRALSLGALFRFQDNPNHHWNCSARRRTVRTTLYVQQQSRHRT